MRKGPGSAYDKWNISVVICDTDIFHSGQPNHGGDRIMNFEEIKGLHPDVFVQTPCSLSQESDKHPLHVLSQLLP
jgi:hypothetical protein